MIERAERFADRLNDTCLKLGCAFLLLMTVLVLIQVVARYLFSSPPSWTEEAARFCMVWGGLMGATVAFRQGLDPVLVQSRKYKSRSLAILGTLGRTLPVLIFLAPLLYYAPGFLLRSMPRIAETIPLSTAFVVVIVPLTAAVVSFYAILALAHAIFGDLNTMDVSEEYKVD